MHKHLTIILCWPFKIINISELPCALFIDTILYMQVAIIRESTIILLIYPLNYMSLINCSYYGTQYVLNCRFAMHVHMYSILDLQNIFYPVIHYTDSPYVILYLNISLKAVHVAIHINIYSTSITFIVLTPMVSYCTSRIFLSDN